MKLIPGALTAGGQPVLMSDEHNVLHKHANIQEAHGIQVLVDGEDQTHWRIEELVVTAPLIKVGTFVATRDFQQTLHVFAQLPHTAGVGLLAL